MEKKFLTENFVLKKVNRIHLELLSFTRKEMKDKEKSIIYNFSYSAKIEDKKQQIKNGKLEEKKEEKEINNTLKLEDTFISSDEKEDSVENSSDLSCEEEIIL